MNERLKKDVINVVSIVPGIVGLSHMNFAEQPSQLKKQNWEKGIQYETTNNGLEVKVSIIASINTRIEVISREISSSIKNLLNKTNIKVNRTIVYIRGVK